MGRRSSSARRLWRTLMATPYSVGPYSVCPYSVWSRRHTRGKGRLGWLDRNAEIGARIQARVGMNQRRAGMTVGPHTRMPPGGVMEFLVLGPLEVRGSARPLGPAGGKQAGVLALLALHANQVVATDRLIHALWGEQPPPSARQALQNHVSAVRKLLADGGGEAVLRTRDPGYVLAVDPERVDAFRFERLAAAGRRALADGEPARAADLLRQALGLWRGAVLPDLGGQAADWPELTVLADRR